MANEKRKPGRPKGELSTFIYQQANFSVEDVGEEIERLLTKTQTAGLTTDRTTVAATFYRLRKDWQNNKQIDASTNLQPATPTLLPIITPPAKPYQPPIISPLAEANISSSDDWFDPQESVYVNFSENRNGKTDGPNRLPYIGRIVGRPDGKAVLPLSAAVIDHLATELKQTGKSSILLPCFLIKNPTYWIADKIDTKRLKSPRDSPTTEQIIDLQKRLQFLESELMQLRRVVAEINDRTKIQPMLIIFDFQNFNASFRDRGTPIHPRLVIDKASHFETLIPRRVVKVVIVDFASSRGKIYCDGNPDYDFYPVSDLTEAEKNPTDQFVYQATCQYVNELKLPLGSLITLVSGDGHFLPLLYDLKNAGYQIMTVGREGHIHSSMKDADFCLILP